jgi:hypothetical protein
VKSVLLLQTGAVSPVQTPIDVQRFTHALMQQVTDRNIAACALISL